MTCNPSRWLLGLLLLLHAPASAGGHWQEPVQAGGEVPEPAWCGSCHPQQLAAWMGSRHSLAFSPGLVGQLLTLSSCQDGEPCLQCHAPLDEQRREWSCSDPLLLWRARPGAGKAGMGVACPSCHLRRGQVAGPTGGEDSPHALRREPLFSASAFCAPCHQSPPQTAVAGKPLQNTMQEWQESPFAAQGVTCQSCHMPGRAHLFRGIHDPDMVSSGLTVTSGKDEQGAWYAVRSTGVGHAFPTYTVARVTLQGRLLNGKGEDIPGGKRRHVVARKIAEGDNGLEEIQDTRLKPGEEARLTVPWKGTAGEGTRVVFSLRVEPDHHYLREVYPLLLARELPAEAAAMLRRANEESAFVLFPREVERTP